jgi:peptidoglycan/LPS O-acetylase OafA/YrhL
MTEPTRTDPQPVGGPHSSVAVARPADPPTRLDSLTGLRYLAAMLVVVHHAVSNPNHPDGMVNLAAVRPLATLGYTGVAFFFALSGFVLAWSWQPGRRPREFWVRRFARVYPLYIVTWLLAIPLMLWLGRNVDGLTVLLGTLLLHAWSSDSSVVFALNAPSWSLSCEAFFYALFPLLILPLAKLPVRRLFAVAVGCFAVLAAVPTVLYLASGKSAVAILYYFPAYRVLEFVIGICLALAMRRGWRPALPPWVGLVTVVLGLALAMVINEAYVSKVSDSVSLPRPAAALVMLPFYVALIAIAAAGDLNGVRSFFASRWMVKLGTWSFAAYMTHLLLIDVIEKLSGDALPVSGAVGNSAVLLGVLVCSTAVSAVAYTAVEHPLERIIRRRWA